ncbi:hypothetical protein SAMN05421809_0750 [Natronorubrum daqingense]|uniref:Uncharacterized protein n=2 Tax=Natronorubrum daqingense TaxID=588898 RepID=A0A1N6ZBN2_9EURY|nr:hypothetical protein [Natronorubrum daqingense]APX95398.1 hypothetical protein BB347_01530 [Natronorubrum daqingense]SIR24224.1 hypothetical protein SAMN05421809_0750 [Natronorubrum daqingense]
MEVTAVVLGAVALFLSGISAAMVVRYRRGSRTQRTIATDLDDRLADAMGPGSGSHLEQPPSVRRIVSIESNDDGKVGGGGEGGEDKKGENDVPTVVPIVRIDLETTDAPGMKFVLEYVANVLETVHPVLESRDVRVAHYDVECTFGPDGLLVEGECRRVSVTPELADRLLEDDRYGAFELWRDVKRGDRDGETPTALWEPCRSSAAIRTRLE